MLFLSQHYHLPGVGHATFSQTDLRHEQFQSKPFKNVWKIMLKMLKHIVCI